MYRPALDQGDTFTGPMNVKRRATLVGDYSSGGEDIIQSKLLIREFIFSDRVKMAS